MKTATLFLGGGTLIFSSENFIFGYKISFGSLIKNNTIYIANCDTYSNPFNSTLDITFIHKLDLNFDAITSHDDINKIDSQSVNANFGSDLTSIYQLTAVNDTPTVLYHSSWTFDPSRPENNMTGYVVINATDCVWPKFPPSAASQDFNMPVYSLDDNYEIQVGTNIHETNIYIPFTQCQGSKFAIQVLDNQTSETPAWMQIDILNENFKIDRSKITSVGQFSLNINYQLIAYTMEQDDYLKYSSDHNETVNFMFKNNNCDLQKTPEISYLVKNVLTTFIVDFIDNENDWVSVKITQSEAYGAFAQPIKGNLSYSILIQSSIATNNLTSIDIMYTDMYHQSTEFWEVLRIQVFLFESEPPIFITTPEGIIVDQCNIKEVTLPEIEDPDGTLPSSLLDVISLSSDTPSSIYLNNSQIVFNLTDTKISYACCSYYIPHTQVRGI